MPMVLVHADMLRDTTAAAQATDDYISDNPDQPYALLMHARLLNVDSPYVWRQVIVPRDTDMKTFQELMTAAFEWAGCHNHGLKVVDIEKRYTLEELENLDQEEQEAEDGEVEDVEEDECEDPGVLEEVADNVQCGQKRGRPSAGEKHAPNGTALGERKGKAGEEGEGKGKGKAKAKAKAEGQDGNAAKKAKTVDESAFATQNFGAPTSR